MFVFFLSSDPLQTKTHLFLLVDEREVGHSGRNLVVFLQQEHPSNETALTHLHFDVTGKDRVFQQKKFAAVSHTDDELSEVNSRGLKVDMRVDVVEPFVSDFDQAFVEDDGGILGAVFRGARVAAFVEHGVAVDVVVVRHWRCWFQWDQRNRVRSIHLCGPKQSFVVFF